MLEKRIIIETRVKRKMIKACQATSRLPPTKRAISKKSYFESDDEDHKEKVYKFKCLDGLGDAAERTPRSALISLMKMAWTYPNPPEDRPNFR